VPGGLEQPGLLAAIVAARSPAHTRLSMIKFSLTRFGLKGTVRDRIAFVIFRHADISVQ